MPYSKSGQLDRIKLPTVIKRFRPANKTQMLDPFCSGPSEIRGAMREIITHEGRFRNVSFGKLGPTHKYLIGTFPSCLWPPMCARPKYHATHRVAYLPHLSCTLIMYNRGGKHIMYNRG